MKSIDDHIDNVARKLGRAFVGLFIAVVLTLLITFGNALLQRYFHVALPSFVISGFLGVLVAWVVSFALKKPQPSKSATGNAQQGIQADAASPRRLT